MIQKRTLVFPILFYAALAVLFYPIFEYFICLDGYRYIGVSEAYIEDGFMEGIDVYWSPLITWLLVPFLLFGAPPLFGFKLLLLMNGVFVLFLSGLLLKKLDIKIKERYFLLFLIALISLSHAFEYTTPDLIFVSMSLVLANVLIADDYIANKYSGVACGIIGGFIYFSKAFGFPYFMACFLLVNLVLFFQKKNRLNRFKILRHTALGLTLFMLISSFWIIPISNKAGSFTISTAGVRHTVLNKVNKVKSSSSDKEGHILNAPNKENVGKAESGFKGFPIFHVIRKQFARCLYNAPDLLKYLLVFSFLSLLIIMGAVYNSVKNKNDRYSEKMSFLLMMVLVLLFGYLLLFIHRRYLILSNYLLLIIGAKLMLDYLNKYKPTQIKKNVFIGIFALSFLVAPIRDFHFFNDLISKINRIITDHQLDELNMDGKVGSYGGDHAHSLTLSLTNGWTYATYFNKLPFADQKDLNSKFEKGGVDYLIVWLPKRERPASLNQFQDITNGEIKELAIYKVRDE